MFSFNRDSPAAYDVKGQRRAWPWARFAILSGLVSAVALEAGPIFYPPVPPPLGAPVPVREAAGVNGAAPLELGAYVNECFYAPLSTQLAAKSSGGKLSEAMRTRLDDYRATKV